MNFTDNIAVTIHSVTLYVRDPDRSVGFYVALGGVATEDRDRAMWDVWFGEAQHLGLYPARGGAVSRVCLGIESGSLLATRECLEQMGIEVSASGFGQITAIDPDGNRVAVLRAM